MQRHGMQNPRPSRPEHCTCAPGGRLHRPLLFHPPHGQELGPEWTLMKAGTPGCPDIEDWLAEHLPDGGRVGIDPFVHTVDSARKLTSKLEAAGKSLVPLLADGNLVDAAWGSERPAMPMAPVRVHSDEWSGESVADKVWTCAHVGLASKCVGGRALTWVVGRCCGGQGVDMRARWAGKQTCGRACTDSGGRAMLWWAGCGRARALGWRASVWAGVH
eukprot:358530-Chlamydomonas_euryale.AAC.1